MSENFESTYESSIPKTFGDTVICGGEGTDTISFGAARPAQDFWYEDGFSLTGNPNYSPDTISFDYKNDFHMNLNIPDLPSAPNNENGFWKYHEDVILKEIRDYLGGTYNAHYASQESKTQTLDLIEGIGDAEPFCRSNAIKYLSRFGKKNGKSKQDILKAIHYCILLYHFAGLCNENTEPYETF
jgi:hypothetical protein